MQLRKPQKQNTKYNIKIKKDTLQLRIKVTEANEALEG